jgi:hypothetical protein
MAVGVVAIAVRSEAKSRAISLLHRLHIFGQPSRLAEANHEHARRERIQRSGVADLDATRQLLLNAIDRRARSHAARFVQDQQAVKFTRRGAHG